MNVYIVGSGAVGTYLGERLAATGAVVTFAPRDPSAVVPVPVDLAIVAVKSYDTIDAIASLRRAFGSDSSATIITPQNGVGNEERLATVFGADRVVSCALTVPVELRADGTANASNHGGVALAPVGGAAHNWLVAAFERTTIPVRVVADYRALKWSKLALNVIANASCAILDVLPGRLVTYGDAFDLEVRAVREVRAVMAKMGLAPIDLPRYPVRLLFGVASLPVFVARPALGRRIAGARGDKMPSLLADTRAGKGRTEVDALNGAVATAGRATGVATPVNAALTRVLLEIAAMPQLRAKYRERPQALIAEVEAEERRSRRSA